VEGNTIRWQRSPWQSLPAIAEKAEELKEVLEVLEVLEVREVAIISPPAPGAIMSAPSSTTA
jgi:hypothetical protein